MTSESMSMAELTKQSTMVKTQLLDTQAELARTEVTGSAEGLVSITVSVTGDPRAVTISPGSLDGSDTDRLERLVLHALQDANALAAEHARAAMTPIADFMKSLA